MKTRTGYLFNRNGRFYVRIKVEKTVITRALKTPDGNPCKTLQDARKAQPLAVQSFTLGNRRDSLRALIQKLAEVERDIALLESPRVKVADCWQTYVSSGERPDSGSQTLVMYELYTRLFKEWLKANYRNTLYLADVSRDMASEYSRHLTTQYSSTTHNKHLFFLKLLFRTLVDGKNPFEKIRPKPKDSTCHEALTQEQLQTILQLAEGELNTLLLVGIYTSLRKKDACLLKWSNLDMEKEIITVTPSKTASRSHKMVIIPIHPQLMIRLETLNHTSEYVLPKMAYWYTHNPEHISRRIKDLFEACGIKTQLEVEGKKGSKKHNKSIHSFHSLRFSMGQNLISNGYTLDQIAQVLGHTTAQMSRHYSTITNDVKTQAILSLPSFVPSEPMSI